MEFLNFFNVILSFGLLYGLSSISLISADSKTNKVYRVTTILNKPFLSSSESKYTGFIPDLLDRISSIINVTFEIDEVGDGRYGSLDLSGNWTGMIGELKTNKADIAAADLTVTAERAKHIHFSHPFTKTGLRILVKKPSIGPPLGDEIFLIFKPFNFEIWVIILLAIVAVSVQFFLIGRYNPDEQLQKKNHVDLTLSNAFFFSFSMLTWQGFSTVPKSHSARILAAFWWLFAFLVIITYIANVTALFLTKSPSGPTVPFYTFEEMSKQTDVKYGYVRAGGTSYYFQTSKEATEQRINSFAKENDEFLVDRTEKGIQLVRSQNGAYAFIMEGATAEHVAAQTPCDLMVVGEFLAERSYSFACRPEIDVCRKLDIAILQLKQQGEIEDLLLKHLSGPCQNYKADMMCSLSEYGLPIKTDVAAVRSITLKRFGGPLIILFIGMLLSGIMMFIEIFLAKRKGVSYGRRLPEDKQTFREPMDLDKDGNQFHD